MKYALIGILLLYSLSGIAYETHEEINALTVDDTLFLICDRLDGEKNCIYGLTDNATPYYDYMTVTGTDCVKPNLAEIEAELSNYKLEIHAWLTDITNFRNEKDLQLSRYNELKQRFGSYLAASSKNNIPNPEAWARDNITRTATWGQINASKLFMDDLYAVKESVDELIDQKEIEEALIKYGNDAINCGKSVIALLSARNGIKPDITAQDVITLNETFSGIKNLLETGSLETAYIQIQTVSIIGTIATEEDRTALMARLQRCMN